MLDTSRTVAIPPLSVTSYPMCREQSWNSVTNLKGQRSTAVAVPCPTAAAPFRGERLVAAQTTSTVRPRPLCLQSLSTTNSV